MQLDGLGLDASDFRLLADYLQDANRCTDLAYLTVTGNSFDEEGLHALAMGIAKNSSLRELRLDPSFLNISAMAILAPCLVNHASLRSLHLDHDLNSPFSLGPDDLAPLAEALATDFSLTSLSLAYNDISPRGAGFLADALKHNATLRTLELCGNSLGAGGACVLSTAMGSACPLFYLGLNDTDIDDESGAQIVRALEGNWRLREISGLGPAGDNVYARNRHNRSLSASVLHDPMFFVGNADLMEELGPRLRRALLQ